jgi:hypothetical protein
MPTIPVSGLPGSPRNPPRLSDCVRAQLRARHCSPRTETAYLHWIRRFAAFHRYRHPRALTTADIGAFLSHLATVDHLSASSQNQALEPLS